VGERGVYPLLSRRPLVIIFKGTTWARKGSQLTQRKGKDRGEKGERSRKGREDEKKDKPLWPINRMAKPGTIPPHYLSNKHLERKSLKSEKIV